MVYNGRPSTGCARCRERRKKCDETKPACLNCVKLGRECPGFPDQLDLMFRNETANVERKATRSGKPIPSKRGSIPKVSPVLKNLEDTIADSGPSRRMSSLSDLSLIANIGGLDIERMSMLDPSTNLSQSSPAETRLRKSFFNTLILQPSQVENAGSKLDAPVNESGAVLSNSPLLLITEAIAVRSVANHPGNDFLILHTNHLYDLALRAVYEALQDSDEGKVEDALNSILLIALYECVASCSFFNHNALLQSAAGPDKSAETYMLHSFHTARSRMFTDNTLRQTVFNQLQAAERLSTFRSGRAVNRCLADYPIQMPDVLVKATELLLPVRSRTLDSVQEVEGLLQEAYDLQNELYRWDMNMPPRFGYKSIVGATGTPNTGMFATSEAWPGPVHVYEDVHVASIRNNNRVSQLLCANVVMASLQWLDPQDYAEDRRYKAAEYRVQYLVDDIAASVPFHYGFGTGRGTETSPQQGGSVIKNNGYFVIWPLYVASQMASISSLQRRWLTGRLDVILQNYGLERCHDRD